MQVPLRIRLAGTRQLRRVWLRRYGPVDRIVPHTTVERIAKCTPLCIDYHLPDWLQLPLGRLPNIDKSAMRRQDKLIFDVAAIILLTSTHLTVHELAYVVVGPWQLRLKKDSGEKQSIMLQKQ
eukprot:6174410-Pleurochrysis_carterae.AAC.4